MNIDAHLRLSNGIFSLFADNVTCIRTWGFYLFSPEFDAEPELRNKIGTIWLASLFDSLEGEQRTVAKYREEAMRLGYAHHVDACDQATRFFRRIEGVLRDYSKAEQLFLNDLRDQWVHSWLARRHRDEFPIKWFDGTSMVRENITRDEYYGLIRPLYESPEGLDPTLFILIQRFRTKPLPYWETLHAIQPVLEGFYESIRNKQTFQLPTLDA